jgi:hypothetical protein
VEELFVFLLQLFESLREQVDADGSRIEDLKS